MLTRPSRLCVTRTAGAGYDGKDLWLDFISTRKNQTITFLTDKIYTSRFRAKFLNVIKLPGVYGVKSKKWDLAKFFDSKNNFLTQDFPVVSFPRFSLPITPRAPLGRSCEKRLRTSQCQMTRGGGLVIWFCSHAVCPAPKGDRFTKGMILWFLEP